MQRQSTPQAAPGFGQPRPIDQSSAWAALAVHIRLGLDIMSHHKRNSAGPNQRSTRAVCTAGIHWSKRLISRHTCLGLEGRVGVRVGVGVGGRVGVGVGIGVGVGARLRARVVSVSRHTAHTSRSGTPCISPVMRHVIVPVSPTTLEREKYVFDPRNSPTKSQPSSPRLGVGVGVGVRVGLGQRRGNGGFGGG